LLAEANPTAERGAGHAAAPRNFYHGVADWDAIADRFIEAAEAKRNGGN